MMLLKNFSINADFISLNHRGEYLDLHNNFELTNIIHNKEQKTVNLLFTKGNGDWVPSNSLDSLILLFKNVSHIYHKDHDPNYPSDYIIQDQCTINMLGFSFDGTDIMDGVTDYVPRQDLPAFIFILETGKAIKIIAESVEIFME